MVQAEKSDISNESQNESNSTSNSLSVSTSTTSVSILSTSSTIQLANASSGAITYTLPASSGNTGLYFHIKKIDSSSNAVIIDGNENETIDGVTTQTITDQYSSVTIACDGSNWHII